MNRGSWLVLSAAAIACGGPPREAPSERAAAPLRVQAPGRLQAEPPPIETAPSPAAAAPVVTGPVSDRASASLSAPLRDLPAAPRPIRPPREAPRPLPLPRAAPGATTAPPPGPQLPFALAAPAPAIPAPILSFDGIGNGFTGPQGTFAVASAPSDANGAVGPDHYVQVVNSELAVFSKSGAVLYGPVPLNTLWSGFGGGCQTNNDGDPLVLYDRLAGQWIIAQFSISTTPYLECVAVSQTGDPTGAYYRYAFSYGTGLNDYAKLGVWPDAYYVTYNMFTNGSTFAGSRVCAWERKKMLSGLPATQQCFNTSTAYGGLLPADLDGHRLPPPGAPNPVVAMGATNASGVGSTLDVWAFHVDWVTPANSTLTGPTSVTVPAFTVLCSTSATGVCVPQLGGGTLDAVSDRLMYRLAYRNMGAYESLVVNHSVAAGAGGGVRWYELRDPAAPVLAQSGTYAPDASYRWMGSAAQDAVGDLAIGFSLSSAALKPAIRYAGRSWNAAAGVMNQGEGTLIDGTGAQGNALSRWGDYSAMSIDPVDDCTFWYTNQYLAADGTFNWKTRIGTFQLPECPPRLTISAPATFPVHTATTVTVTAQDQLGATLTSYVGPASFTTSDPGATAPASLTFTAGVATASVTLATLGSVTLTATDPVDPTRLTATSTVTAGPGAAASFTFSGLPGSTAAGAALAATITAKDAWGNVATGYAGTGNVASDDPQATVPATVTFVSGVATLAATLKTAGARTLTVTDAVDAALTATAAVTVTPAAAARYAVGGLPASATAGAALSGTVTAQDAYGNTATAYAGTGNVTSGDPQATLPAPLAFASGVAGLSVTLKTAGARTITVTDSVSATITGSASVGVSPAAVAAYAFGGFPASTTAGAGLSGTVTARDAYGNTVPAYAGTGTVASSDAQATIPATISFSGGVATLSATLRTAGSRSLSAADSASAAIAGSASVQVSPAAAASLALSGLPATATAGTALSGTLAAYDAFGNAATGYAGTATVTSSDAQAAVPASVAFAAGVASLPVTLRTAGARSITATDQANAALTANASVQVSPAAASVYVVTLPAAPAVGAAVDLGVAARDAFGNAASGYAGTGRVTSSDAHATLPPDLVFAAGSAAGKITFGAAGAQTVTVTDVAQPSLTATASAQIAAPPAAASPSHGCGCGTAAASDLAGLLLGVVGLWRGGRRGRARQGRARSR